MRRINSIKCAFLQIIFERIYWFNTYNSKIQNPSETITSEFQEGGQYNEKQTNEIEVTFNNNASNFFSYRIIRKL